MSDIIIDKFADIRILRYRINGFEKLNLTNKKLLYYLSKAALYGRDILWDQNGTENIKIRKLFECIYKHQKATNTLDDRLIEYIKKIWFANGVHHHYSNDKFEPTFTHNELLDWALAVPTEKFMRQMGACAQDIISELNTIIFDKNYKPKKVCLDEKQDLVKSSSVNFYKDVTQKDVEKLYTEGLGQNALNSCVVRDNNGQAIEIVWRLGGLYNNAIKKIIYWLRKAQEIATNEKQSKVIGLLIKYYKTGKISDFDEFNKEWVTEKKSPIDFINGFIEVYSDPLGLKGTWESIVELKDKKATEQIKLISSNAQWFEDHSPIAPIYRKSKVSGVSMNVVNAVMLGGDCYPSTPIGVNLPNADWIREQYGSKSISLNNITHAYNEAARDSGVLNEFAASKAEIERCRKFGSVSDDLHTQLHECLGHGSGQMAQGITLDDLKSYGSTIEEARADLFALYFMADDKMQELGIAPTKEIAWAHYDSYLRNGLLVQMARIAIGKDIEEAHMRNRQLICKWVMEHSVKEQYAAIIERNGKHYVEIYNYEALRKLFGELLYEVQRIKSEGDYEAAKNLVEKYGVKLDSELHKEIIERYKSLNCSPFSGFVNPRLNAIKKGNEIIDITIDYTESYTDQMLRYSKQYSTL